MSKATPSQALYNFRLLSALRSDDATQLQPFLDALKGDASRAGVLLGMAVKVGTGELCISLLMGRDTHVPMSIGDERMGH